MSLASPGLNTATRPDDDCAASRRGRVASATRWINRDCVISRAKRLQSASRELRKGKYAIDYLNVPYCMIVSVLLLPSPSLFSPNHPCPPLASRRRRRRARFAAGNACLAFPGIVTTPSASEYCQPPRLNCITYYCLLFGARFARYVLLLSPCARLESSLFGPHASYSFLRPSAANFILFDLRFFLHNAFSQSI